MRACDISLEVDCAPARFWRLYFDPEFNRDTFVQGLGWELPTILEFRETEAEIIRNVSAYPRLELPGKVAKLIGEKLGYREWGRFERASSEFHFRHQTNIFGERMTIAGKMWAEPLAGPGTGERALERMVWRTRLTIVCTIPGVGGLIERAVEHNVHKSWPDCSRHWNRWIPAHPDAGRAQTESA
jgi:hypothetical protein